MVLPFTQASQVAQLVKNPPAMQETLGQFLGWEDPLEKGWIPTPASLGFPGGSDGKESPAIQETWVRSLGREDPLGEAMATHCSILAWRIPRTAEPGGLQSMGSQRAGHD